MSRRAGEMRGILIRNKDILQQVLARLPGDRTNLVSPCAVVSEAAIDVRAAVVARAAVRAVTRAVVRAVVVVEAVFGWGVRSPLGFSPPMVGRTSLPARCSRLRSG